MGHPPSASGLIHSDLSYQIIGVFFEVYNKLGYGFLESIYAKAIELRLKRRGLCVEREVPMTVTLDGDDLGVFRCDMVVDRRIIIEIKATEKLSEIPRRQLRNYLRAFDMELGLLLHFGPKANHYRVIGPRGGLNAPEEDAAKSDESG